MGAGYEKQEGQHDKLYKASMGLERVNKSPGTPFWDAFTALLHFF